jgi:copper transport protein
MRNAWPLALSLLLGTARVASAHATLVRSSPAAGSHLAAAPGVLRLEFSEQIEPGLARVSVVASDGHEIPIEVRADPRDVNALVASLDPLPDDAYRLVWRVVSADGHPVDGSFVFTVGASAANRVAAPATPGEHSHAASDVSLLTALLRGLAVGLLMAVAGLLAFRWNATRALGQSSARRSARVASWTALLAAACCILHLGAWMAHVSPSHVLDMSSMRAAAASDVGRLELWRTGLAVLAAWALVLARRELLALAFATGALIVSGATGHSAAITPLVATPAKVVHLLAGAVWLGGLVWLLALARDEASILREARRVSAAALISVVLVAVSGVLQALLFMPTPVDVVRTRYGTLVLVKLLGLLLLVALGARHRFRLLPRLERDASVHAQPFLQSVSVEVLLMSIVIIIGGVLAYVPPTQ